MAGNFKGLIQVGRHSFLAEDVEDFDPAVLIPPDRPVRPEHIQSPLSMSPWTQSNVPFKHHQKWRKSMIKDGMK